MNIEEFTTYCLEKAGVEDSFPFNETTLVFKVVKMFALTSIESFESINLKCDPDYAVELREKYMGISPGFHMNKTHWNTVRVNEDVPDQLIYELIDHSYHLIVKSLTKKQKLELGFYES